LFHTVSAQRFALTIGEVDEVFAATTEEEMYAWVEAIEKAGGLKREPEVKKETFIQKVEKRTILYSYSAALVLYCTHTLLYPR
jgi:hypothetical protein